MAYPDKFRMQGMEKMSEFYYATDNFTGWFSDSGVCSMCGEFKGNPKAPPLSQSYGYTSKRPYFFIP